MARRWGAAILVLAVVLSATPHYMLGSEQSYSYSIVDPFYYDLVAKAFVATWSSYSATVSIDVEGLMPGYKNLVLGVRIVPSPDTWGVSVEYEGSRRQGSTLLVNLEVRVEGPLVLPVTYAVDGGVLVEVSDVGRLLRVNVTLAGLKGYINASGLATKGSYPLVPRLDVPELYEGWSGEGVLRAYGIPIAIPRVSYSLYLDPANNTLYYSGDSLRVIGDFFPLFPYPLILGPEVVMGIVRSNTVNVIEALGDESLLEGVALRALNYSSDPEEASLAAAREIYYKAVLPRAHYMGSECIIAPLGNLYIECRGTAPEARIPVLEPDPEGVLALLRGAIEGDPALVEDAASKMITLRGTSLVLPQGKYLEGPVDTILRASSQGSSVEIAKIPVPGLGFEGGYAILKAIPAGKRYRSLEGLVLELLRESGLIQDNATSIPQNISYEYRDPVLTIYINGEEALRRVLLFDNLGTDYAMLRVVGSLAATLNKPEKIAEWSLPKALTSVEEASIKAIALLIKEAITRGASAADPEDALKLLEEEYSKFARKPASIETKLQTTTRTPKGVEEATVLNETQGTAITTHGGGLAMQKLLPAFLAGMAIGALLTLIGPVAVKRTLQRRPRSREASSRL